MDNSRRPLQGGTARAGTATAAAGPAVAAAVAALAARAAYAGLRRHPPGGEKTWARANHRGELVTLLEGPAVALGTVCGLAAGTAVTGAAGARRDGRPPSAHPGTERVRAFALAPTAATLGGLGLGLLDDHYGSGKRRGLRGHLGALAHGEVTTGTVKLAGLTVTGLGAALLDGGSPADVAVNAGLIAGGANLLNLFDLRPGRAAKVAAGTAVLIAAAGAATGGPSRTAAIAAAAAPAGAALALLPEDLTERSMLGDAGANALGAALGAAAARSLPRPARAGLLAAMVALILASEKVSFTRVIERTPPLRWLDMLGRRPAPLTAPVAGSAAGAASGHGQTAAARPRAAGGNHAGPPPAGGADGHAAVPGTAETARRRRRPGRHRRGAVTEGRDRSGGWFSALRQPPPQEP